jgi:isocitrate dehydrogenase
MIVDIGAARLADAPGQFDVIVMPNLYGDILSDVAAEIAGSVGLAGSANIGEHVAMFEAIHGSAPTIAGLDIANPSGLILAGVQMLVHLGQTEAADRLHNAWLRTIEDGVHTFDIHKEGVSSRLVGSQAFADAVIERLGGQPATLPEVSYAGKPTLNLAPQKPAPRQHKQMVGLDVFVDWAGGAPDEVASAMKSALGPGLDGLIDLVMITNRGVKVWPGGMPETFCTDHWRVRYMGAPGKELNRSVMVDLLRNLGATGVDFVKTEGLYTFDGEPGFSLGQGQ